MSFRRPWIRTEPQLPRILDLECIRQTEDGRKLRAERGVRFEFADGGLRDAGLRFELFLRESRALTGGA